MVLMVAQPPFLRSVFGYPREAMITEPTTTTRQKMAKFWQR